MELVIIYIIYIILSAFGIAGTGMWKDLPTLINVILCIIFGWILFPCMIAFVFGKFINNVNDRYQYGKKIR